MQQNSRDRRDPRAGHDAGKPIGPLRGGHESVLDPAEPRLDHAVHRVEWGVDAVEPLSNVYEGSLKMGQKRPAFVVLRSRQRQGV
jgi:hypothetical protein